MTRITLAATAATIALSGAPLLAQDKTPEDTCGSTDYAETIGTQHADHDFEKDDRPLRIIPPNSAVTMDYRAERLNVDIDENGLVVRIWCG